jgi:hypothetical protein
MSLPLRVSAQELNGAGYAFDCALIEPQSGRSPDASVPSQDIDARPKLPLSPTQARFLIQRSAKLLGWRSSQMVDVEELYDAAVDHLMALTDLSTRGIAVLLTRIRLPVDTIALVFAAFSLGAIATAETGHGRFYFDVSTEMVKYFVGPPTLNLCLSYFLQHLLALRFGTSNYAQGIISQAIHIAHTLGLQQQSHGSRGLLLFLLIYMADQLSGSAKEGKPS